MRQAQAKTSEAEERYKAFIEHSSEGIWRFELDQPVSIKLSPRKQIDFFYTHAYLAECNDAMAKMYGLRKARQLIGARLGDMLPQTDPDNMAYLTAFVRSGYKLHNAVSHEIDSTGNRKIFQNNLTGIVQDGLLLRAWGIQRDITEQTIVQERQQFLENVSKKLVVSLDATITLTDIAKLIVPQLADYCRIVTLDEEGHIKEIAVNHKERAKITLVKDLFNSYKNLSEANYGVPTILRTGKSEIISMIDDKLFKKYKKNKKVMEIVKQIGLTSYMGVPLIRRAKVIGAITFSSTQELRRYTKDDLHFAEDLAHRIALTLENSRLYTEAQKAIMLRDDFISIASHELKTPLTSVKMYTQIIHKKLQELGNVSLSLHVRKMETQVDRLTELINDLLDISRMQHGKLELHKQSFDLGESVRDVIETIQSTASHHQIIVQGSIRRKVLGDKDRIGQVVINLLTNAIKYSPYSKRIEVSLAQEKDIAVVSVRDYGIGIEEKDQKKIFDRFYRGHGLNDETFPGFGIGLYISHEIIRRHDGIMTVVSKKGKGSQFSFTLPYAKKNIRL